MNATKDLFKKRYAKKFILLICLFGYIPLYGMEMVRQSFLHQLPSELIALLLLFKARSEASLPDFYVSPYSLLKRYTKIQEFLKVALKNYSTTRFDAIYIMLIHHISSCITPTNEMQKVISCVSAERNNNIQEIPIIKAFVTRAHIAFSISHPTAISWIKKSIHDDQLYQQISSVLLSFAVLRNQASVEHLLIAGAPANACLSDEVIAIHNPNFLCQAGESLLNVAIYLALPNIMLKLLQYIDKIPQSTSEEKRPITSHSNLYGTISRVG